MTRQLDNSLYRYSQRSAGTINYDINGLNQIDYILSGDNFTYDTDGNLTDIGTTDDYAYDDRHRLTETPAGTDLTYGADGNLDTLTTARQFTYDGTNITIERNASDAIAYRYVHAGGLGAPALRLSGTGNTTQEFYLTDERGSVIAATNTSGARAYINTYDEYGVEGTGNSGLYGYTGQVRLGDNSLTHNRNRAYGAALGQFLQTDPIGQAGGINLYAYVGGDPINFVDPWGLEEHAVAMKFQTNRIVGNPAQLQQVIVLYVSFAGTSAVREYLVRAGSAVGSGQMTLMKMCRETEREVPIDMKSTS